MSYLSAESCINFLAVAKGTSTYRMTMKGKLNEKLRKRGGLRFSMRGYKVFNEGV